MSERIDDIRSAVQTIHHCAARHAASVPVREMFDDKVVWEGVVEVFDLLRHPQAIRCYAWRFMDGNEPRYVTVLELPPVDSPQTAVKVAIAASLRKEPPPTRETGDDYQAYHGIPYTPD